MNQKKKKLILVSNDDGVDSKGIKELVKFLRKIPHTHVVMVAPNRERSAASHSLTLHRPLRYEKVGQDAYAVDGTPTDCVVLALHEILERKPDLVVSGINRGGNLGDDVHYSGTVSAAMEAGIAGIPAIAISLVLLHNHKAHFSIAAEYSQSLVEKVLDKGIAPGVILNVNIPNLTHEKISGIKVCKLGKRNYGAILVEKIDPRGRPYFWITGDETGFEDIQDSDCNAILENYISVTPVTVDMTHKKTFKEMKHWSF